MILQIHGTAEEVHDMLDRLSSQEIGVLDDLDSRLMNLHQKVNKLEKSIPDPIKMWQELEKKSEKHRNTDIK